MNLAYLSLYHCPRGAVPPAPTNEDRRRVWRDLQPVTLENAYPWPHLEPREPEKEHG